MCVFDLLLEGFLPVGVADPNPFELLLVESHLAAHGFLFVNEGGYLLL
jgi:hypothetical protein